MRPLDVGDVLDRMFRLLVEHWRTYFVALGVILVPTQFVLAFLQQRTTGGVGFLEMMADPAAAQGRLPFDPGSIVALYSVAVVYSLLVTPLVTGIGCAIGAAGHRGEQPEPAPVLRRAGRSYASLLATVFLSWFLPLLLLVPGAALLFAGAVTNSAALAVAGAFVVLAGLAGAIALFVLFLLGVPVVIVERTGPATALSRSASLVRRRFWRVLGIALLAWIVAGIVGAIVAIPLTTVGGLFGGMLGYAFTAVGGSISAILQTPLTANAQTLLYYDARVRTEGLDLEIMTERLADDR